MRFMYYYIIHNIPNILYLTTYEMYLGFQLNQLGNNDKNYFNYLYTHACTPIFMTQNIPTYIIVIIFKSIAHANIVSLLVCVYNCGELFGALRKQIYHIHIDRYRRYL